MKFKNFMSKKQEKETVMTDNELEEKENVSAEASESIENIVEQDPLSVMQKEIEAQKDKYIRLLAEFENYKRRTAKDRIDWFKTAGQDIIKDLLPVIDDAERAEFALNAATDIAAVKAGLNLITEKLKSTFTQKGLQAMDCKGKEFDSDTMEAITEIPAPSEDLIGKVVDVVEKGYTLNEKIIRYAKVVVGK